MMGLTTGAVPGCGSGSWKRGFFCMKGKERLLTLATEIEDGLGKLEEVGGVPAHLPKVSKRRGRSLTLD